MKLTKTSGWTLATTGLCVALVAGGWFGLVDPQRAAAAESREQTEAAVVANAQLEQKIEQLRVQFADLPARQAELAAIRLALPEEPALAQLIRDVNGHSGDAGTVLNSIVTGAPVAVIDPAAVAAPVEEPTDTGEAGGEAGAEPSAEPSATPSADASAPATDPSVVGTPAAPAAPAQPVLAAIPVTITSTGDFTSSTLFLKNIQADMPRALLVDSLTLAVDESADEPGTVVTTITGRVFVFVDPTPIPDAPTGPGAEPSTEPSTEPSDG
jgi:Tfp pilus assembly protein PilO